jgi:hypothetical protein
MPDIKAGQTQTKNEESYLEISLEAAPLKLETSGGREITFIGAMLSMANTGIAVLVGVVPHATIAKEGGLIHNATGAPSRSKIVESMEPGETVKWDVYDLLLVAHPSLVSKVYLWGYEAVLGWWLEFVAWAEYRTPDVATPLQTPKHRWKLRWSPAKSQADEIDLSWEVMKD